MQLSIIWFAGGLNQSESLRRPVIHKSFTVRLSDMAAHDSSDRQWYLGRIRDNRCKIVQFDANGLFEYPKPFNHDCFTKLELITAILTLLARALTKNYTTQNLPGMVTF